MTVSTDNQLERFIREQKLSLQKISESTGVSTLALEYMTTQGIVPKPHVAQKLAKYIGVPVREIWPQLG